MLRRITLRNFQKHRKLILPLERITTIVGRSDVGKSAIIRAIRWACINKPGGSAFIRKGQKRCSVTLLVENSTVKRIRGPGTKNEYRLTGKKSGTYKAFGSTTPKAVHRLLKVSEDNFQGQHDAPYWLSLSAGQVSKSLNEVVDLGSIDSSLDNLNKEYKRAVLTIEITESRLKEARAEKQKYRYALRKHKELKQLETLQGKMKAAAGRREALETALQEAVYASRKAKATQKACRKIEAFLSDVEALVQRMESVREKTEEIGRILDHHRNERQRLKQLRLELKSVTRALDKIKVCKTCGRPL
jgi:exonuclease SbcC